MTRKHAGRRILLVRMDRIGDLILTLPVDQAFPGADISWWVTKGLGFVVEASRPKRHAREVQRRITFLEFFGLVRDVHRERFDAAIVFHGPWWINLLLWLARVPLRAGVKSQWHSYLFLNRAIRQKRSQAETSELEYNFRLVERVFDLEEGSLQRSSLKLECDSEEHRLSVLKQQGVENEKYFVVHPGMGGSALNWPIEHYIQLIHRLCEHAPVVITGTKTDEPYLAPLRSALTKTGTDTKHSVLWLDGRLKGSELIAVLASAKAIVAPSTGVLHIAASTGRPTLGLFSPVRVQQPRRWGPQGPRAQTLIPGVSTCPGQMRCLGSDCALFDCMASISVEEVLKTIEGI